MTTQETNDWNSRSPEVQADQIAAYDEMRSKCPVAYDEYMGYSLFRNEDIQFALAHPQIFSNAISNRHIAVPKGMDAPEHTPFRAIKDKYFTAERMVGFEPKIRAVVHDIIKNLPPQPGN